MVKNIFNWTVGSFFRSIGRIVAYLVIGIAIAYLLRLGDIDLGELNLFMTVHASTNVTSIWQPDMWKANGDKLTYSTFGFLQGFDTSGGGNGERSVVLTYFNSNISVSGGGLPVPDGYDYMSFRVAIYNPLNATLDGNMAMSLSFQTQNNWGSGSNCEIISDSSVQFYNNQRLAKLYTVKCPIINGTTSISTFNVSYIATNGALFAMELSGDILFFKSGTMTDQQIIQKQQETIDTLNDNTQAINQTITDTNTNSSVTDANSLFEDGNLTSSERSLQAIVSAPLQIINNLVTDGSSNPLCFTLNSKQTCIPDGSIIWNNQYTSDWFQGGSKSLFITLFNVIVGGFLAYKMFLSLYRIVDDMLNPTNNRIEVMRL